MLNLTEEQAAATVRGLEGPRISIPIALIRRLGDLTAAAFLQQAAYLSSIKGGDYWFDLPQLGPGQADLEDSNASLWAKLGSWEAILGVGQDAQVAARRRIEAAAPGLLQTRKRGIPAHLVYRVSPSAYLKFLSDLGLQSPGSPDSRVRENRTLESGDSGGKHRAKAEAIPKSIPKSHTKERARAPTRRRGGFAVDQETGLHYKPDDLDDVVALAEIREHPPGALAKAREQAASRDDLGRAFPAAVLRLLRGGQQVTPPTSGAAPAWATATERYPYRRL
jgi:hypothetical protein